MDHCISHGDTTEKNILEAERVCSCHFHKGQPAKDFDQFNPNLLPSLNLGKKEYQPPKDFKASVAKLMIPIFTIGLKQLDPIDVEETRGIANVVSMLRG